MFCACRIALVVGFVSESCRGGAEWLLRSLLLGDTHYLYLLGLSPGYSGLQIIGCQGVGVASNHDDACDHTH